MNKMLSTVALLAIAGNVLMAGGDIAPVEPVVPEVVVSDSWNYSAAIYLWAAGVEGEAADGTDFDMSFSDILDDLDMTFMGNFFAQKGKWTFGSDVMYIKISDKPNTDLGGDNTLTKVQLKNWVITPTVAYRVMESEKLDLDVLAGARYLDMEATIGLDGVNHTDSGGVTDGIVGVRGKYDLNGKWYMPFQFDVGGGDSDVVWQAFAGVGYEYENFDLIVAYRYLEWDFDTGEALNDMSMSGPVFGAKFKF